MTAEECLERCNVAGFEDKGRGPGAKVCRQPLEIGKDKEKNSSLESPERNAAPLTH